MDISSFRYLFIGFIFLLVVACGGSSSNDPDPTSTDIVYSGRFIDSAVEGLRYQTATQSGTTNASGTFQYRSGETVSFFIGDIALGSASGASQITPIDLVAGATDSANPQVVNLIRFIQSLDSDGNPDNGIQISSDIFDLASGQSLDFSLDASAFEAIANALLNYLTSGSVTSLVDEIIAIAHFESTLNGGIPIGADYGDLTLSGDDTSVIGSNFDPSYGFGLPSSGRYMFSNDNRVLLVERFDHVDPPLVTAGYLYREETEDTSRYYIHGPCTDSCVGLEINSESQVLVFNNFELQVNENRADNLATGPLTLNGTLSW